ncbi:MAG: alpha-N-acetylglucosaminidase C-terminal domain-containing protein [Rikenellaceae bacterium]
MLRKSIIAVIFIAYTLVGVARSKSDLPIVGLLERYAKEEVNRFDFEITDPQSTNDFFTVSSTKNKVYISGNNNLSLAAGLNFYLKEIANITLTPYQMNFTLPKDLVEITAPIRHQTEITTRTYLNEESYKGERIYWGVEEWQKEIDRMALSGVNMTYMPIGVGSVLRNALLESGCSEEQVSRFLPMPSYYCWWLQGLCDGGAEELPIWWYDKEKALHNFISTELRKWEIEVIAPGYNGIQTPSEISKEEFAKHYYSQIKNLYGDIRYFRVPTLKAFSLLQQNNNNATWVYDTSLDSATDLEIATLPRGKVLLLSSYEKLLSWDKTGVTGHHDFILRPSKDEALENIYNRNYRNRLLFCGIELIDNDVFRINANFLSSYIWNNALPYQDYIKIYVKHGYGKENPIIEKAIETMYSQSTSEVRPFIYSEPTLQLSPTIDISKTSSYMSALKAFAGEAAQYSSNALYQHDLIIFTQAALYNRLAELITKMANSVDSRSVDFFKKESDKFLSLIMMLDKLYNTISEFRYDKYLELGRAKGISFPEKGVYEGDIRRYTTIWGDRYTSNMLRKNDMCYSPKSGILGDYYYNRWFMYIKSLDGIINNRIGSDIDYYNIGKEWSEQRNTFPEQPKSSTILRAVEVINELNAPL